MFLHRSKVPPLLSVFYHELHTQGKILFQFLHQISVHSGPKFGVFRHLVVWKGFLSFALSRFAPRYRRERPVGGGGFEREWCHALRVCVRVCASRSLGLRRCKKDTRRAWLCSGVVCVLFGVVRGKCIFPKLWARRRGRTEMLCSKKGIELVGAFFGVRRASFDVRASLWQGCVDVM